MNARRNRANRMWTQANARAQVAQDNANFAADNFTATGEQGVSSVIARLKAGLAAARHALQYINAARKELQEALRFAEANGLTADAADISQELDALALNEAMVRNEAVRLEVMRMFSEMGIALSLSAEDYNAMRDNINALVRQGSSLRDAIAKAANEWLQAKMSAVIMQIFNGANIAISAEQLSGLMPEILNGANDNAMAHDQYRFTLNDLAAAARENAAEMLTDAYREALQAAGITRDVAREDVQALLNIMKLSGELCTADVIAKYAASRVENERALRQEVETAFGELLREMGIERAPLSDEVSRVSNAVMSARNKGDTREVKAIITSIFGVRLEGMKQRLVTRFAGMARKAQGLVRSALRMSDSVERNVANAMRAFNTIDERGANTVERELKAGRQAIDAAREQLASAREELNAMLAFSEQNGLKKEAEKIRSALAKVALYETTINMLDMRIGIMEAVFNMGIAVTLRDADFVRIEARAQEISKDMIGTFGMALSQAAIEWVKARVAGEIVVAMGESNIYLTEDEGLAMANDVISEAKDLSMARGGWRFDLSHVRQEAQRKAGVILTNAYNEALSAAGIDRTATKEDTQGLLNIMSLSGELCTADVIRKYAASRVANEKALRQEVETAFGELLSDMGIGRTPLSDEVNRVSNAVMAARNKGDTRDVKAIITSIFGARLEGLKQRLVARFAGMARKAAGLVRSALRMSDSVERNVANAMQAFNAIDEKGTNTVGNELRAGRQAIDKARSQLAGAREELNAMLEFSEQNGLKKEAEKIRVALAKVTLYETTINMLDMRIGIMETVFDLGMAVTLRDADFVRIESNALRKQQETGMTLMAALSEAAFEWAEARVASELVVAFSEAQMYLTESESLAMAEEIMAELNDPLAVPGSWRFNMSHVRGIANERMTNVARNVYNKALQAAGIARGITSQDVEGLLADIRGSEQLAMANDIVRIAQARVAQELALRQTAREEFAALLKEQGLLRNPTSREVDIAVEAIQKARSQNDERAVSEILKEALGDRLAGLASTVRSTLYEHWNAAGASWTAANAQAQIINDNVEEALANFNKTDEAGTRSVEAAIKSGQQALQAMRRNIRSARSELNSALQFAKENGLTDAVVQIQEELEALALNEAMVNVAYARLMIVNTFFAMGVAVTVWDVHMEDMIDLINERVSQGASLDAAISEVANEWIETRIISEIVDTFTAAGIFITRNEARQIMQSVILEARDLSMAKDQWRFNISENIAQVANEKIERIIISVYAKALRDAGITRKLTRQDIQGALAQIQGQGTLATASDIQRVIAERVEQEKGRVEEVGRELTAFFNEEGIARDPNTITSLPTHSLFSHLTTRALIFSEI
ncbi:MAG: hypothetical protein ABH885_01160, partial [Candidatus Omnitrophota bacterium]